MLSLKNNFSSERGVVLPAVLFVTLIGCSLAATAVASAIVSQRQSTHDRQVKRAMQAANAGLDTALYRLNMLEPSAGDCVVLSGGTLGKDSSAASMKTMSDGSKWCVAVTGELGDGESYSYRVSDLNSGASTRTIVATGMVGDVQRRIAATAKLQLDAPLFKYAAVGFDSDASVHESRVNTSTKVWEDWCDDTNSNGKQPDHHCGANIATNGPLRIDNSSAVCGQAYDDNGNIDVLHGGKLNPLEHSTFIVAGDDRLCPTGNLGNPSTAIAGDHSTEQCTSAGAVPISDCEDTVTHKFMWSKVVDEMRATDLQAGDSLDQPVELQQLRAQHSRRLPACLRRRQADGHGRARQHIHQHHLGPGRAVAGTEKQLARRPARWRLRVLLSEPGGNRGAALQGARDHPHLLEGSGGLPGSRLPGKRQTARSIRTGALRDLGLGRQLRNRRRLLQRRRRRDRRLPRRIDPAVLSPGIDQHHPPRSPTSTAPRAPPPRTISPPSSGRRPRRSTSTTAAG